MTIEHQTSIRHRTSTKRNTRVKTVKKPTVAEPKLMQILEVRTGPDGGKIEVTRADKIVAYLRTNAPLSAAAAAAGVNKKILYEWLRIGAEAQVKRTNRITLRQIEKVCLEFTERCDAAVAEGHVRAAGALTRMAEGGTEEKVITEKVDGRGRVIERSERKTNLAPSVSALTLLMSRRWPEQWAGVDKEAVTSGGGGMARVSVAELADVIDGLHDKISRRQAALNAITATSEPDPDVVDAELVEDEPPS